MDIVTPAQRSKNMAVIKSRDTKPELYFRKLLFSRGYRYRIAPGNIPGHPDIFLKRFNTAVFVHGCFWHRHSGCKYAYNPKSREEFWQKKFADNIRRDAVVKEQLMDRQIKCLVIWECTINKMRKSVQFQEEIVSEIEKFFSSDVLNMEF